MEDQFVQEAKKRKLSSTAAEETECPGTLVNGAGKGDHGATDDASAAAAAPAQQQAGEQQEDPAAASEAAPPVKRQRRRKGQDASPEQAMLHQHIHAIRSAAKSNDLRSALAVFEAVRASEGRVQLPQQVFNSLLYLASGGEAWERHARGLEVEREPGVEPVGKEEMVSAAEAVWGYMEQHGIAADHTAHLSMARSAALRGDAERAHEWATRSSGIKGNPVQLRLFHPALVSYVLRGDVAAAAVIDGEIAVHGLDLTEYEFARLVEVAASAGDYKFLNAVLMRMQEELNELAPATVALLEAFFRGDKAVPFAALPHVSQQQEQQEQQEVSVAGGVDATAEAASGKSGAANGNSGSSDGAASGGGVPSAWHVSRVLVDKVTGACPAAGGSLQLVDLKDEEWNTFAEGVASLAIKNEGRKSDFEAYKEWYDRNGPYDILVDGANVAFYGQNRAGGGFSWAQIMAMWQVITKEHPNSRALLMLHKKRIYDPEARQPAVQLFLEKLRRAKAFYYTPPGSNDDWYWLYATVRAKGNGLLISNDELRDHIWSLLRPKHFLKWKQRHIAHYTFPYPPAGGQQASATEAVAEPSPSGNGVAEEAAAVVATGGEDGAAASSGPHSEGAAAAAAPDGAATAASVAAKAPAVPDAPTSIEAFLADALAAGAGGERGATASPAPAAAASTQGGAADPAVAAVVQQPSQQHDAQEGGNRSPALPAGSKPPPPSRANGVQAHKPPTFCLPPGTVMPLILRPPVYTSCVQQLANGCWMFPCVDGSWLCARPVTGKAAVAAAAAAAAAEPEAAIDVAEAMQS